MKEVRSDCRWSSRGKMGARVMPITNGTPLGETLSGHRKIGSSICWKGYWRGDWFRGKMGVILESYLKKGGGDVIINFRQSQLPFESLAFAKEAGLAIVIGTTGLNSEQMNKVKELSKNVRCVLAPNMSVGVNVMFRIVQEVAKVLGPEYDIEILEAHHRLKKDSCTAMETGELVDFQVPGRDFGKVGVYGRRGMVGERTKDEIGMQVVRAGDIVGEHTVLFGGIGERLGVATGP